MFKLVCKECSYAIGIAMANFLKKPVSPSISDTMMKPRKKSSDNKRCDDNLVSGIVLVPGNISLIVLIF